MQATHCPICYGELEVREVTPCDDCGGRPKELEHFREGMHAYAIYEVFPGLELTLCDFCAVDFASKINLQKLETSVRARVYSCRHETLRFLSS
jgi:hypothetical protein